MDLTLLAMAAGMGSRYGGVKQMDAVGPWGETLLDYALYDALRAGFKKAIFVIRREIEEGFKEGIIKRVGPHMEVDYVFQDLTACLPKGFEVPEGRKKPWGTAQAVLVAREKIKGTFAVINADDFYGRSAFEHLSHFLRTNGQDYGLMAYQLKNTLSDYGAVSRGICNIDQEGNLVSVTEHRKIAKDAGGELIAWLEEGRAIRFTGNERVSLNLWGFRPNLFGYLEKQFEEFLKSSGNDLKKELYLPEVVDLAVGDGLAKVAVLSTNERWFGITYREDLQVVRNHILAKIEAGEYPERLWA